jgi:hypothetical protein
VIRWLFAWLFPRLVRLARSQGANVLRQALQHSTKTVRPPRPTRVKVYRPTRTPRFPTT